MHRRRNHGFTSYIIARFHSLSVKAWRVITGLILLVGILPIEPVSAEPTATTYYVSSSSGSDSNTGKDESHPLKTISAVNNLTLNPGDQVLFKCGDTWRAEILNVTQSGTSGSPITYSTYPSGCESQPILDGTQPVTGWSVYSGNIYVASLTSGTNQSLFGSNDINQVFRDGERLTMGRWPNVTASDGGYSTVDSQPSSTKITDSALPTSVDWTGAIVHIKVIRWSMVNREVTGISGTTLTLNQDPGCWYGTCEGWGYFINNHLATLDTDGEWYYDSSTHKLYLYSSANPSANTIEASVVLGDTDRNFGGVLLGVDLYDSVSYIVIDNLDIRGWFQNGISSPTNLHPDENSNITIKNNTIRDVDDSGINLFSWVWSASDGLDGWRGGNNIVIQNNVIDGANSFGIHTPSRETTIEYNTIENIGLIENLNASGMGCGTTGSEGTCTEDGAGLRIYVDDADRSGYDFTIRYNRFENIGAAGIQTFGSDTTIANNVFYYTCISKGDCGAVNTYGTGTLSSSNVHDIQIVDNLILYTIGNTDGTHTNFRGLFGFGVYLDNGSRNVTTQGNTIAYSTVAGVLYQNATGLVSDNTLFQNVNGSLWTSQVVVTSSPSALTSFSANTMVAPNSHSYNLSVPSASQISAADNNRYYHMDNANMQVSLNGSGKSLAQWQSASGKDANSITGTTEYASKMMLFYNDTDTEMEASSAGLEFADLDGNDLGASFTLAAYSSQVVVVTKDTRAKMYIPLLER